MNKPLPQPGDTILDKLHGTFICCTLEHLQETYNLGRLEMYPKAIYGYSPRDTTHAAGWMSYSEDDCPEFIRCFKNKPKDKIFFQSSKYIPRDNATVTGCLEQEQKPWHNLKLTYCGESGTLKACETIQIN